MSEVIQSSWVPNQKPNLRLNNKQTFQKRLGFIVKNKVVELSSGVPLTQMQYHVLKGDN